MGHHLVASRCTFDGSDQLLSDLLHLQNDASNLIHRAVVSISSETLGSWSPSQAPEIAGHLASRAPCQMIAGKVHEPMLARVQCCICNLNSSLHTLYRPAFRPNIGSCMPDKPYMNGTFFFVWCQPLWSQVDLSYAEWRSLHARHGERLQIQIHIRDTLDSIARS